MREPLSTEVFSEIIASIYDCAVDPGRWQQTLAFLRGAMDCANATLSMHAMPSGKPILAVWAGTEPIWVERAAQFGAEIMELWGGPEKVLSYPLDNPVALSRVTTRSGWGTNRFYTEWAVPQGLCDVMAITLARDAGMVASVGLGRHYSVGDLGDIELNTAQLLIPHLQRAVAIGRLLDIQNVASSAFEATLDTLAVAVVLIDAGLRIVHLNEAARATLALAEMPVRVRAGTLTVRPSAVQAALRDAVVQAAEDESKLGRRGFGIPAATVTGTPWILHVLPLNRGRLRPGLALDAVAAIFVTPAKAPKPVPADALAALFDLTPTEARVFVQIASGVTRQQTGQALGIASTTVKSHLSRIFLKTGTHRQADLVALCASLSLPLLQ
jgi:DNA-binding CsgD family transcriptional regulator/PAS domain-containing protein